MVDHTKTYLHDQLRRARRALLSALDGLDEYEVRLPRTASGTNLLGLVKHVAVWDSRYLGEVFGRPYEPALPRWDDWGSLGTDFWATDDESTADIIDLCLGVERHTDETIESLELTDLGHVPWWGETVPLYNLMLHCLLETTRHAGHADVLRESVDGRLGDTPESLRHVGDDRARWAAHRSMLEGIAERFRQ